MSMATKLAKLIWTARKKEIFLSSVVLTIEELDVFNQLITGYTYEEIAENKLWGAKKVASIAKVIKAKYMVVQLEYPDIFEPLPE